MAHVHIIVDHDKHFIIDPITKKIQPENPEKNKLVRYDHNSERYTFEMDRMLEGHDMSLCDIVQIHYINVSSNKQKKNEDIYEVNDLGLLSGNEDRIAFTWLVSRNATMLDGILTFAIRFACSNGDSIDYELHTEIFSSISISNTIINNGQSIVEEYSDILNQWKKELFGIEGTIQTAKRESLAAIDKNRTDSLNAINSARESSLEAIDRYGLVQVSEEDPTNPNIDVHINPNTTESFTVPEIIDDSIGPEDTWSSEKINTKLSKVNTDVTALKEDLGVTKSQLSESFSEPTTIELHPTKNSGYYWNGAAASSSYFYYHIDVKEGDVVTIPLSISAVALQEVRFIDAYKGTERNTDASIQLVSEYVVPKDVDNIYLSVNFRQDYYDYYYVSILRTVEELKPKGISDLTNRVSVLENVIVETKNGYTLKKEMDNLASGSLITLSEHIDNKKNKSYRFSAKFNTFSSVTIGHGYNVYSGSWVTVDSTNVTAYYYNGSQAVQMGQYAHGLTISDFIDVVITVGNVENLRAVVTVMSVGGDFTQTNVPMGGCNGSVFAFGGQNLIDVVYSYNLTDMLSDIWLFGDSYISLGDPNRWTYQLMQYGYKDLLMCGFSGATSSNEILAFREIVQIGKPKIVVWALGMNDADNGQANQTWLACVNEVISFCAENGIELVLATIPCTPKVDNSYKNTYIKESPYRYIDFAKAVNGETVGSSWYADMLSSDNVHPVALGAKALANRFLLDVPEVTKSN